MAMKIYAVIVTVAFLATSGMADGRPDPYRIRRQLTPEEKQEKFDEYERILIRAARRIHYGKSCDVLEPEIVQAVMHIPVSIPSGVEPKHLDGVELKYTVDNRPEN